MMPSKFTQKQGRYLAFIHQYTLLHGQPPAETDMQRFFGTSPPAVHQMVVSLARAGLIARVPRQPRSIKIVVPVNELPSLEHEPIKGEGSGLTPSSKDQDHASLVPRLAGLALQHLFDEYEAICLDDQDFAPLVRSVAEAVEADACAAGASPGAAGAVRDAVLDAAVGTYVRLCAEHDPDGADAVADARRFRRLMKHKS